MAAITNVRELVRKASGPLATTYCCPYCMFHERVPKYAALGRTGAGRGYGLASSSTASAAVVAHIKSKHADKLAAGERK